MGGMRFGMRLRELWSHRLGLVVSLAIALFAAFWSVEKVSLFPPGVESRNLETASASTRVLVDMPKSLALDLSVQAQVVNLVNTFFRDKLTAMPTIKEYIDAMQAESTAH